jgi:hypothetical protein
MKRFSDMGIAPELKGFVGDKIKLERILNREIIVHAFKIEESKFKGSCLHMQIELKGEKHVVFTGSTVLMNIIKQVPAADFPFTATIIKTNDYFEFT